MAQEGLKRSLGIPATVAAACGLVVASTTLVSLGQGFGIGGPGFIIAMIIAVLINLFVAFSFAELSGIIPKAGSIDHYTLPALGRFLAILAVLSGYVTVTVFAGSAEAAVPGFVFSEVFAPGIPPVVYSTIVVLLLAYINYRGIELFGWVQIVLTSIMIGTLVIMGIAGLFSLSVTPPLPAEGPFNPMGWGVLALTALGFWLFVGIEYVTPMAEEVKRPGVMIPISMISALAIILVAKVLFGFASIRYVPLGMLAESEAPQVLAGEAIFGLPGVYWMAIVTILASASTVNTLLAAIPRLLYGMASKGQAPSFFGRLNTRYQTPALGIALVALCILIPIWIGIAGIEMIVVFILAGAFSWFISYIIAHLNVIILRVKYPDVPRSFKTPLYPLPQLLGIASMIYMIINIFPDPVMKAAIYRYALIFLALSAVWAVIWVRVIQKKPLFAPVPLEEVREASLAEAAGTAKTTASHGG